MTDTHMTDTQKNLQMESDPFYRNWTELIIPDRLELDQASYTERFGKFTCQPLERGYATTVGNCLRRILLSSIQGAAITSVKIEGAHHEYSTLVGILEDVTEIILNLKEVRLRLNSAEPSVIKIEKSENGPVTAADIVSPAVPGTTTFTVVAIPATTLSTYALRDRSLSATGSPPVVFGTSENVLTPATVWLSSRFTIKSSIASYI